MKIDFKILLLALLLNIFFVNFAVHSAEIPKFDPPDFPEIKMPEVEVSPQERSDYNRQLRNLRDIVWSQLDSIDNPEYLIFQIEVYKSLRKEAHPYAIECEAMHEYYSIRIRDNGDKAIDHMYRGIANYYCLKFSKAIDDFSAVIDKNDSYRNEAFVHRGLAYEATFQIDAAIKDYQTALESDVEYAKAHFYLGRMLAYTGDVDGSIDNLSVAYESANDTESVFLKLSLLNETIFDLYCKTSAGFFLGDAYFYSGDYDKAIQIYLETSSIPTIHKNIYLLMRLARAYVTTDQLEQAMETINEILDIVKSEKPAIFHDQELLDSLKVFHGKLRNTSSLPHSEEILEKAEKYLAMKQYDGAIKYFTAFHILEPSETTTLRTIADLMQKQKRWKDAVDYYYRYLFSSPDADDRIDVNKKIADILKKHNWSF